MLFKRNRFHFFILLSIVLALFSACEEVGPDIELEEETTTDTTYIAAQVETPQQKNVLLEEFTGVRCINCPQGHELLDNLEAQHGARFIAISNHSEFLAVPYEGDQDLRVEDAQKIEDLLGPIIAKPTGAVDRKLFAAQTTRVYYMQNWANYVNEQLNLTTPVNIHIETEFHNENRNLDVVVTLHYTSEVTTEHKLTVLLVEDSIITAQYGHSGIEEEYVQNRVLRRALTSTNGLTLDTTKEMGRVIVKSFVEEALPELWDANELRVIALVHLSATEKNVVHAVQEEVN